MINIYEVLRRSEEGPYIVENDFDMKLYKVTSRLVKEHGLKFNRELPVVGDDAMANHLFEAAMCLALEMGMLCVSTSRVIRFTEEELRLALRTAPKQFTIGTGRDARVMRARTFGDGYPMLVCGGCPGTPLPEELFLPVMMSYAREPLLDLIIPGSLTTIEGMEVRTNGPLEIRACRQEMIWMREALDRCGRSGVHIYAAGESSSTELGTLAIANEKYMRLSDSHMIPVLSELKTDNARLSRVMTGYEYPAFTTSLIDPIIGGFGGGAEGAAVVLAAAVMLSTAAYGVDMHCLHPIHNKLISSTTKEAMWVDSIVGRAFANNAPVALLADAWTTAGAGTADVLYEAAALAILDETSALNSDALGSTNGVYPNCSGLEARFYAEVVHAAFQQKLTPDQANELIAKLWEKYKGGFTAPNFGKCFDQVYDVKTVMPTAEWLDIYHRVKEDVASMGLNFGA
ncbi:MAG TPA: monomethylamine:corrinoid methyltransferase [Anaerolineaceae bacterium]|nr:monomethylamine:corrinoid methyltransferase [Anaerolineaceae bacterium]